MGSVEFGTTIGAFGAGPIGAAVGAVIGATFGLGMAWFITLPTGEALGKSTALLVFSGGIIVLILKFGGR